MQAQRRFILGQPNYLDVFFYFITLVFCYFCFNQSDLLHVAGSSFTYLNGHFKDFYEVNNSLMGKASTTYLPSSYMLFAIWNLPVKLLGIVNQATMHVGGVIFWYKLFTTLFFFGAACWMYKIGRLIGLNPKNAGL